MTQHILDQRHEFLATTDSGLGLRRMLARVVVTLSQWHERARQRRQLAELPPELLCDIGVSVDEARAEVSKPFWH